MQKTFALSTTEVEYYSASEISVEIIYLRNLIQNMGSPQEDDTPVYGDNNLSLLSKDALNGATKHQWTQTRKAYQHQQTLCT